jgi:hypothetical protein
MTAPLTIDSLAAAAAVLNTGLEELWVDQFARLGALDAFAESLRARGVPLDAPGRRCSTIMSIWTSSASSLRRRKPFAAVWRSTASSRASGASSVAVSC